jgi:hypothetical protein
MSDSHHRWVDGSCHNLNDTYFQDLLGYGKVEPTEIYWFVPGENTFRVIFGLSEEE